MPRCGEQQEEEGARAAPPPGMIGDQPITDSETN